MHIREDIFIFYLVTSWYFFLGKGIGLKTIRLILLSDVVTVNFARLKINSKRVNVPNSYINVKHENK